MKRSPKIWLIGGTSDSKALAQELVNRGLSCIVTVTTEDARSLYLNLPNLSAELQVWVGKFQETTLDEFRRSQTIGVILDASHPYALTISQQAIALSAKHHIPYLRYERQSLPETPDSGDLQTIENIQTLLSADYLTNHRVMLTVGYQMLPLFQTWHNRAILFARVLPSPQSIRVAREAGFSSDRLIAIRPPVPEALELALWQHWQISLVVTKASGKAGGEAIKRQACDRLGIPLITIARPKIDYPQQTNDIQTAIAFCTENLHKNFQQFI